MVSVAAESRVKMPEEETRAAIPQLIFAGAVLTFSPQAAYLLSCLHRLLNRLICPSSPKQTLQFLPLVHRMEPPSRTIAPTSTPIRTPAAQGSAKRAQRFLLFLPFGRGPRCTAVTRLQRRIWAKMPH